MKRCLTLFVLGLLAVLIGCEFFSSAKEDGSTQPELTEGDFETVAPGFQ